MSMTIRFRKIIGIIFLFVMVATLGCGGGSTTQQADRSKEVIEAKSEDILGDYIRDVGTAEQKYKSKEVKITGKVVETGQFKNSTRFFVRTGYNYVGGKMYTILLDYPVERVQEINELKIGDFIVAEGVFKGVVPQDDPTVISVQLSVSEDRRVKKVETATVERQVVVVQSSEKEKILNVQGQIKGSDVRLRSGPGTNTTILGHFQNNEIVTIQEIQEGWYKVARTNGQIGWVSASFCVKIN